MLKLPRWKPQIILNVEATTMVVIKCTFGFVSLGIFSSSVAPSVMKAKAQVALKYRVACYCLKLRFENSDVLLLHMIVKHTHCGTRGQTC